MKVTKLNTTYQIESVLNAQGMENSQIFNTEIAQ